MSVFIYIKISVKPGRLGELGELLSRRIARTDGLDKDSIALMTTEVGEVNTLFLLVECREDLAMVRHISDWCRSFHNDEVELLRDISLEVCMSAPGSVKFKDFQSSGVNAVLVRRLSNTYQISANGKFALVPLTGALASFYSFDLLSSHDDAVQLSSDRSYLLDEACKESMMLTFFDI